MIEAHFRYGSLVFLFFSLPGLERPANAETLPAIYRTDEFLDRLDEHNKRIKKFSIEYQASGPGVPYYIHKTIAARYPDSCFYRGAKGPADFDWQGDVVDARWKNDPFQDWILVTTDRSYWGSPWSRVYGDFPFERDGPFPFKIQEQALFVALGWWPFEKRPWPELPGSEPCVIPQIVRAKRHSVSPRQELRGGEWCHVLENPGRDRLWINPDRGFSIVAREVYDAKTGAKISQIEASRFRKVGSGIWVPHEIRNIEYDSHAPTSEGRRQRLLDSRIQILDVRVNGDVDDALFEPEPKPAGAIFVADDRSYEQIVPGGFEVMDKTVKWLSTRANPQAKRPASWSLSSLSRLSKEAIRDYGIMTAAVLILIGRSLQGGGRF